MNNITTSMKDDLYASVTGRIVAALERGAPPWYGRGHRTSTACR
jgi:antirestriction protein ArdC